MKFTLVVEEPQNGDHFTPMEEVHGHIELEVSETERMDSIQILFQGGLSCQLSIPFIDRMQCRLLIIIGKIKVSFMPRATSEVPAQFQGPRVLRETYIVWAHHSLVELVR